MEIEATLTKLPFWDNLSEQERTLTKCGATHHSYEKGVYIFDFSDNGIPNYGGTRDYIDSTKLTMFQVRFNSNKAGRVRIVSENLARLV